MPQAPRNGYRKALEQDAAMNLNGFRTKIAETLQKRMVTGMATGKTTIQRMNKYLA